MNILLYVLTLLTAMSIMTFARLQTFLNVATVRQEYACLMGEEDRIAMNQIQTKLYDTHNGKGTKKENGKKTDATRKVNFILFVNRDLREQNDPAFQTLNTIIKSLMTNLYKKEPFYIKIQETKGDPSEVLMAQITRVADEREGNTVVKSLGNLKTLDLQDPELQELFSKMLGGEKEYKEKSSCPKPSKPSYPSLLNYIEIKKHKDGSIQPIRIQLAPPEVIEAIFIDPNIVDEIISTREELRNQSGKLGSTEQQVASQEFERLFKSRLPGNLDQNLFDFTITTTK